MDAGCFGWRCCDKIDARPQNDEGIKETERPADPGFGVNVGGGGGGGANGNKSECVANEAETALRCEGQGFGEVPREEIPPRLVLFSMRQTSVTAIRYRM